MWRLGSRMLPLIPNRAHIVQGGHTMLYPNRRDVLITLGALAAGAATQPRLLEMDECRHIVHLPAKSNGAIHISG